MKEKRNDLLFDCAIFALCILMALLLTACGKPNTVTTVSLAASAPATTIPKTTEPETTVPETTVPPQTTLPSRPSVEKYFSDRSSWQNIALWAADFDGTVRLHYLFCKPFEGQSTTLTDRERQLLPDIAARIDEFPNWNVLRYTREQIDEVLLHCYGKNADTLGVDLLSAFTYLEETDLYYRIDSSFGWRVDFDRTEERSDGTIAMYYDVPEDPARNWGRIAILQPHETGYYVLSNGMFYDNTGKTDEQIAMEALFRDHNDWYGRGMTCTFSDPTQLKLINIFYGGFDDESQHPTDAEWALLKDQPGFNENYDLMRLPAAKMNAVLTQYFGITLADIPDSGTNGLVYLPSADCYYFMTTGAMTVEGLLVGDIQHLEDGTIRMEYTLNKPSNAFVIRLKPVADGYRILSNLPLSEDVTESPKTADMTNLIAAASAMGISLAGTAFLALGGDALRSLRKRKSK